MLFEAQILQREGWSVLSVVGDLDLATMPAFKQRADQVTGGRVACDLSGVDHLDPVAFGVVVAFALRVRRFGGRFVVVCPPGRPRELFAETRLDSIVEVVDSFEGL